MANCNPSARWGSGSLYRASLSFYFVSILPVFLLGPSIFLLRLRKDLTPSPKTLSYAKTQSKNSNGEEGRPACGQLGGGEADAGGDLPQVVVPGGGDRYDDHRYDQDPHDDQQDNCD